MEPSEAASVTPSTSGRFSVWADKENVNPVTGILTRAQRAAGSPLTPGAEAAAARDAGMTATTPGAHSWWLVAALLRLPLDDCKGPCAACVPCPRSDRISRHTTHSPCGRGPEGAGGQRCAGPGRVRSSHHMAVFRPNAVPPGLPPAPLPRLSPAHAPTQARRARRDARRWRTSRSGWRRHALPPRLHFKPPTTAVGILTRAPPSPRHHRGALQPAAAGKKARVSRLLRGAAECSSLCKLF